MAQHSFQDILGLLDLTPAEKKAQKSRELSQGLFGLANALAKAGAPRRGGKQSTFSGLGMGLQGFQQGIQATRDDALKQRFKKLQLASVVANAKSALTNAETGRVKGNMPVPARDELSRLQKLLRKGNLTAEEEKQVRARIAKITALPVGQNITIQSRTGKRFGEKQDEIAREKVLAAGDKASTVLNDLGKLGDLLMDPATQTGTVQEKVIGLQGLAEDLGIDLSAVASRVGLTLGKLANQQQFRRLSSRIVLDSLDKLRGSLQVKELEFVKKTAAGLGDSEQSNIRAIAAATAAQELIERRADELLVEEEKTPDDLRAAFRRFRRNRKPDLKFLRERTAFHEKELTEARKRNSAAPPEARINAQAIIANPNATSEDVDRAIQEIRALKALRGG